MLKPNLNLDIFDLNDLNLSTLDERTFVIRKWNWDYKSAHAFQKNSVKLVQENPQIRILVCCNHPRVFTNGRGLQKPRKGENLELVEFKQEEHQQLPYPLHQIERGGGLTFHHPGQFIFYPIIKLNPNTLSLSKMTHDVFDFSREILNSWGINELSHTNKFMGLWYQEKKLASMGIAIEKLTTYHGMALNLLKDQAMHEALLKLNPCGLSGSTYISVQELTTLPEETLDNFCDLFLQKVAHAWK
jgi:lipoyl(octanoyl) transferase